jgi:IS30 family transposase
MEKNYSRITFGERRHIEKSLNERMSMTAMGKDLNRSTDTISREVKRNSIFKQTGGFGTVFNNCLYRDTCSESNLCENGDCRRSSCCGCKFCSRVCKKYERVTCFRLKDPPYCCNGCSERSRCTLEKAIYNAKVADKSASEVLSSSRSGINLGEAERLRLNDIVTPLLKKRQTPWHICETQKDLLMISDKTLYKYINAGLFDATNFDLARKLKMKPRKKKPTIKIEKACREGRTYRDFWDWLEKYPDTDVVQMDTVEGKKGAGEKVLLTIHFPHSEFMMAFIRDANTARSVTEIFNSIKSVLGFERFKEMFNLVLTDNGSEFTNPSAIETDKKEKKWTRIFYCDPYSSFQKGSIEAGHRLIRKVIPKGISMNGFSQKDIELLMCHVNSYTRKALGKKTPYNAFSSMHGDKTAEMLGIRLIPPNEINLTPKLLK